MERVSETTEVRINKVEPIGIKYPAQRKHEGYRASRHLTKFNAENASVFTESNNVCRIPVQSGSFLDLNQALLHFKLKNNATGHPIQLDDTASCVINRIRILNLQGGELERLESYGLLSNVIDHYTGSFDDYNTTSALSGGPGKFDYTPAQTTIAAANSNVNKLSGETLTLNGANTIEVAAKGGQGFLQNQSDILNNNIQRNYSIKLKGAWFNPDHKNYLPPNTGFVLELTFGTGAASFKSTTAAAVYTVENCILSAPAIRVDDADLMNRMNLNNRSLSWTGTTFSHHINTSPATTNSRNVVQLAVRCFVLKGLLSVFRIQSELNTLSKFSLSKSTLQGIQNYVYQIGSENYPQQQIDLKINAAANLSGGGTVEGTRVILPGETDNKISEAYGEVVRFFQGMKGNHAQGGGLVNPEAYAQGTNNNGAGVIAVSTEPYGADGNIHNGIDTASTAMPVQLSFQTSGQANSIQQIDTYAMCQVQFMRDADGNVSSEY
tara:strand:- start:1668 stop:3149 length:1482 start_codon:yes stop_codon:yes gene_type:complete